MPTTSDTPSTDTSAARLAAVEQQLRDVSDQLGHVAAAVTMIGLTVTRAQLAADRAAALVKRWRPRVVAGRVRRWAVGLLLPRRWAQQPDTSPRSLR